MPRNMSYAMTTRQARNKEKDVTRRNGWKFLKPRDIVQQVVKGMGLKKGEKVEKIHLIRIKSTRWEPLNRMILEPVYGYEECRREGFPDMTPDEFVAMYCKANKCKPDKLVNRIEFEYLD